MKKISLGLAALVLSFAMLAGCSSPSSSENENSGNGGSGGNGGNNVPNLSENGWMKTDENFKTSVLLEETTENGTSGYKITVVKQKLNPLRQVTLQSGLIIPSGNVYSGIVTRVSLNSTTLSTPTIFDETDNVQISLTKKEHTADLTISNYPSPGGDTTFSDLLNGTVTDIEESSMPALIGY